MTKNLIPHQRRIPKVLVSQKYYIELLFGPMMRQRGIGHPKFHASLRLPAAPPTSGCFGDFSWSQIDP
jgi:hypothetical protein